MMILGVILILLFLAYLSLATVLEKLPLQNISDNAPVSKVAGAVPPSNKVTSSPRGVRNNNPGNLRDTGQAWKGLVGADSGGFCIFSEPKFGWRAMVIDVIGDVKNDGLDTLTKLISEYAPASDGNNPGQYAAIVAKDMRINIWDKLTPVTRNMTVGLISAMAEVEQGQNCIFLWGPDAFAYGIDSGLSHLGVA